ncbi:MAG: hypothetical protein HY074_19575 [Deltaproteobacteria bacterium]|nr:hypothetical protein [Deltaproteobacteria bacterium]
MPSFNEIIGVIATFIVLSTASGHGNVVWEAISKLCRVAITNTRQDWGCPSVFAGRGACASYDPARYR